MLLFSMTSANCTELIRITRETLDRQARIIEILLDMQRTLNFALLDRRREIKSGEPSGEKIFLVQH